MLPKLVDLARCQARLSRISDGSVWYQILLGEKEPGGPVHIFDFPVPFGDIGSATFNTQEPAMQLLKWVRRQHEMLAHAQAERPEE